jgi:hypothetical protein
MGVVGEQPERPDPQGGEAGGSFGVIARVGREAEVHVGLQCVEAVFLKRVRAQLVEKTDAAALVPGRIDQDASALGGDGPQRGP